MQGPILRSSVGNEIENALEEFTKLAFISRAAAPNVP